MMGKIHFNKKVVIRNGCLILLCVSMILYIISQSDKNLKTIEKTRIEADNSSNQEVQEMLFDSNDNGIVINLGNACWMFYEFSGDKVSSLKYYYDYETENKAKAALEEYHTSKDTVKMDAEKIEEVKREGQYIIITPVVSAYENTTKQEVLETYELLQALYQKEEK